jgi:hypothetical protein
MCNREGVSEHSFCIQDRAFELQNDEFQGYNVVKSQRHNISINLPSYSTASKMIENRGKAMTP